MLPRAIAASALTLALVLVPLGPASGSLAEADESPPYGPHPLDPVTSNDRVVVGFEDALPGELPDELADEGEVVLRIPQIDALVIRTEDGREQEVIEQARRLPGVEYAERDEPIRAMDEPNDLLYPQQWGVHAVRLPQAWAIQDGTHDVDVHVLDTGVDLAHADLAPNLCSTGQSFQDLTLGTEGGFPVQGLDVRTPEAVDTGGHGTHVAGIAGAATDNRIGIAGASQSCITPVRVLVGAVGLASWAAAGIVWSADHGADVASMSFGSGNNSSVEYDAVQYAREEGVTLIAAAGNNGCGGGNLLSEGGIGFPARYDDVVAVAALDNSTSRASYSSCGPQLDVAAPGSDVWSTYPGNTYRSLSGTSMAAPMVSGVAGLVLAENPDLVPWEVRCILRVTAADLGPTWKFGDGRLDARDAVERAPDPPTGCIDDVSLTEGVANVDPGETFEVCWRFTGFHQVTIEHTHLHWRWSGDDTVRETPVQSRSGGLPASFCDTVEAPSDVGRITIVAHGLTPDEEEFSAEGSLWVT